MTLASTLEIIAELKAGRMVILVDEEDRENEGDLVIAAEFITPEAINFMARYGRGLICLTLTQERCRLLNLPLMTHRNGTQYGTAFTVSIEAAEGVTTGISAADRAHTIATAVAANARTEDIVQPGHVFPLRARVGGVLQRTGQTEASVDLARLAGLNPAGVICEVMKDDGTMARVDDLIPYCREHGLKLVTVADLIEYRRRRDVFVERLNKIPGFRCQSPDGAFYAWVNIEETGKSAEEVQKILLEEVGVAGIAGAAFGAEGKNYLRFSLVSATHLLEDALERIQRATMHWRATVSR